MLAGMLGLSVLLNGADAIRLRSITSAPNASGEKPFKTFALNGFGLRSISTDANDLVDCDIVLIFMV